MTESLTTGLLLGGRYRLIYPVGRGGMAEVWRAEAVGASGFRRPVAIKRILPHLVDSGQFREMFVEEARVAAALDHPNVVQVFDYGEDGAIGPYIVMEWVDGANLRDLSEYWTALAAAVAAPRPPRDSRLTIVSPALVAGIGIEVLRALDAAHRHTIVKPDGARAAAPIVHRDVSPANVLISERGIVKLADFGLARAFDRARMTPEGIVKGKIAYLAPEQLAGAEGSVRTDVYSCAAMLWEAIAGRRLFRGMDDASIVRTLLARAPHPPLRAVRRDVPEGVGAAIDRGLSVDPDRRFASAAEFARALARALRAIPEPSDANGIASEVGAFLAARRAAAAAEDLSAFEVEFTIDDEPDEITRAPVRGSTSTGAKPAPRASSPNASGRASGPGGTPRASSPSGAARASGAGPAAAAAARTSGSVKPAESSPGVSASPRASAPEPASDPVLGRPERVAG